MELEIVQAGHPVLRQQARPLTPAEITSKEIQKLIESMRKTMYEAPGVGLAAPQIGLSLQLAVIEDREEYHKEVAAEQLRERDRRPVPSTWRTLPGAAWAVARSFCFSRSASTAASFSSDAAIFSRCPACTSDLEPGWADVPAA